MLLWTISAALAQELTLQEALDRALQHNPELGQARLELSMSEAALQQARGAFDPTLNLGVDTSGSSERSNDVEEVAELSTQNTGWSVSASQRLPTGGSASVGWTESLSESNSQQQVLTTSTSDALWLSVSQPLLDGAGPRAARYGVRSAALGLNQQELSLRMSLEQLVLDVSDAYWSLVAARESHDLARRSREIAEQQLADTLERQAEGFAGSGDVLQFERTVGVARQDEVIAEAEVEAASDRLTRLIGGELSGPDQRPTDYPQVPEVAPDAASSLALARQNNASWLSAQMEADQARLSFLQARNAALPDVDATGAVGLSGGPDDIDESRSQLLSAQYPSWSLGLDLAVPLPARDPRAAWERARMDLDQAELALAAAEQDLILQVEGAVRAVRRDHARLTLADQTLAAAEKALAADQELLQEGKGSSRNVVLSLEAMAAAQVARLSAEIDLQSSLLQLARAEGVLLERVGLL